MAETGFRVVRVFVDKGITFPFRESADVAELLIYGYITLAGPAKSKRSVSFVKRY